MKIVDVLDKNLTIERKTKNMNKNSAKLPKIMMYLFEKGFLFEGLRINIVFLLIHEQVYEN